MANSLIERRSAALDPSTTATDLAELAKDGDLIVRRRVASAVDLGQSSISLLAVDPDPIVREKIASRPDLEPSIRGELAKDTRWNVREMAEAVDQPGAPELAAVDNADVADSDSAELLARATNADRTVRLSLAGETDVLPGEVLEALVHDDDALVRHAVACREQSLPDSVAAQLLADTEWPVRMAFASRTDLTNEQRTQLLQDPEDKVRAKISASGS